MALVIAKKAPLQSKVIDHLARSLLASFVLTRGERRTSWRRGKLLMKVRTWPTNFGREIGKP